MKFVIIAVVFLCLAFFIGLYLTLFYPRHVTTTAAPVIQEFTPQGLSTVPTGTIAATILGSIAISGDIPVGSTVNVDARQIGTQQFTTIVQNLPAKSNQTFSYTKATGGAMYDMKVTLLDPTSKVIGTSDVVTVSAPALNAQFSVMSAVLPATPTTTPTPPVPTEQTNAAPTAISSSKTPTPTPTAVSASLSGDISFHGEAPVNSRIVVLQKLSNASSYQLVVDNLSPVDGTLWQWNGSISGNSYSIIAVLKQKQSDGSDIDITSSAPVTVSAPAGFIVLTVNSYYTLTKPAGTSNVTCGTFNSGPNQNSWNVTVNFPSFTNAQSYWLEIGTTNGGNDLVTTNGNTLTVSTVFKNNTTYYARYAYAAVSGVDTGSGQYSAFSDTTQLMCGR